MPLVVGYFTKFEVLALEEELINTYKPTLNRQRAFVGIGKSNDSEYSKRHRKMNREDYNTYVKKYRERNKSAISKRRKEVLTQNRDTCQVCGGVTSGI